MKLFAILSSALCATLATARGPQQRPLTTTGTVNIPSLGFGTWNLIRHNASEAVSAAIQAGYRHIDCAAIYGNEKEVGKGIRDGLEKTGLSRENLWITSKLWNNAHGADNVAPAIAKTLSDLDLTYLDLYLIHWPVASTPGGLHEIEYLDTWHGMEAAVHAGKTRHIGISNFSPYQVSKLQIAATIKPAVHQYESHPYLQQSEFLAWHHTIGIAVTAYSPLANLNPSYAKRPDTDTSTWPPSIMENGAIRHIAAKRGCTAAQVVLKWGMGHEGGTAVIPKSSHEERIVENYDSLDCDLKWEDYDTIGEMQDHGDFVKRFNKMGASWGVELFEGLEDGDDY